MKQFLTNFSSFRARPSIAYLVDYTAVREKTEWTASLREAKSEIEVRSLLEQTAGNDPYIAQGPELYLSPFAIVALEKRVKM